MPQTSNDLLDQTTVSDATARFYDNVAPGYDAQVDGRMDVDNLGIREAFCRRVAAAAGPDGSILDFGCGTGIDAAWYAARGHRVIAYDLSPGMMAVLRERCRGEIAAGRIATAAGALEAMERVLDADGPVAAIAANFAVLNHVRDLVPMLHRLAVHLLPGGALVASVLNPFYGHDMRQGWWWRSALRSLGQGAIRMEGRVTTYRHFIATWRRAAAPAFSVETICTADADGAADEHSISRALGANYLFVQLRKRA